MQPILEWIRTHTFTCRSNKRSVFLFSILFFTTDEENYNITDIKDIGIIIDSELTFNQHINSIIDAANKIVSLEDLIEV